MAAHRRRDLSSPPSRLCPSRTPVRLVARGNRGLRRTPDQRWRTRDCHNGALYQALPQTTQRAGPALARLKRKRKQGMAKVVVLLSPDQRAKLLRIPDSFSERDITR